MATKQMFLLAWAFAVGVFAIACAVRAVECQLRGDYVSTALFAVAVVVNAFNAVQIQARAE